MRKNLWFIWSAFFYSIVIYLGLSYFLVTSSNGAVNPEIVPIIASVSVLMALIAGVISIIIRIKLLSQPIQDGRLDLQTEQGRQKYQTISIVNWALSESIAVFGLVVVVVSGIFYYAIPFSIVSMVLLILQRPQIDTDE